VETLTSEVIDWLQSCKAEHVISHFHIYKGLPSRHDATSSGSTVHGPVEQVSTIYTGEVLHINGRQWVQRVGDTRRTILFSSESQLYEIGESYVGHWGNAGGHDPDNPPIERRMDDGDERDTATFCSGVKGQPVETQMRC
jgi:hypothetical protein